MSQNTYTVMIFGATGMLGQALMREASKRGVKAIGAARSGTDLCLDMLDERVLRDYVKNIKPEIVINAAAITNLDVCEKNPGLALLTNARSVAVLAEVLLEIGAYFIQISTDHYFIGDKNLQHTEISPVRLVNEYARSKYAGEGFALTCPGSLVVRTNIVGFRYKKEQPTFAEWVFSSLKNEISMILFEDFFTSSIDVTQFSRALFNMLEQRPAGVLNLATREVFSKKHFIEAIATHLGCTLSQTRAGSILELGGVQRAESLGLDVFKAETILGYNLPTMHEVVEQLVLEYKETL